MLVVAGKLGEMQNFRTKTFVGANFQSSTDLLSSTKGKFDVS